MKRTYADVIRIIEASKEMLYVAVFYESHHEWLPVDKTEYLRQLQMISNPSSVDYPCYFEVDHDFGEMFIHPKVLNDGSNGLIPYPSSPLSRLASLQHLRPNTL